MYTLNSKTRIGAHINDKRMLLLHNKSYVLNSDQFSFVAQFKDNQIEVSPDVYGSSFFQYLLSKQIVVVASGDKTEHKMIQELFILIKRIALFRIYFSVPPSIEKIMLNPLMKMLLIILTTMAYLFVVYDITLPNAQFLNINFHYFEEHWYIPYIVGIFMAMLHEFIMSFWIYQMGGVVDRFYIRVSFLIFLSIGSGKSAIYLLSKRERIHIILMSTIQIIAVPVLAISVALSSSNYETKTLLESISLVSTVMILASSYPFLLRGDGYLLFQDITGVYALKQKFFELAKNFVKRDDTQHLDAYSQKVVMAWGMLFILSIFFVLLLAVLGIQIIP